MAKYENNKGQTKLLALALVALMGAAAFGAVAVYAQGDGVYTFDEFVSQLKIFIFGITGGVTVNAAVCGDGVITTPPEACDYNYVPNEGCETPTSLPGVSVIPRCTYDCATCRIAPKCGDGYYTPNSETCDATSSAPRGGCAVGYTCTAGCTCAAVVCGNGVKETGEACDPPGYPTSGCPDSTYTCSANCQTCIPSECGNWVVEDGEVCDPPYEQDGCPDGQTCEYDCMSCVGGGAFCGDSNVDEGEQCDPPGTVCDPNAPLGRPPGIGGLGIQSFYTCGQDCMCNVYNPECGDGTLDPPEQCDDGNNNNGDGCSSACITEYCGDGIVNNGEQCDIFSPLGAGTPCCWQPGTPDECKFKPSTEVCAGSDLCSTTSCADSCTAAGTKTVAHCPGNSVTCPGPTSQGCTISCTPGETTCKLIGADGPQSACVALQCGNGVIECGEQCERPLNGDISPFGLCCNSVTCQFKPQNTVCAAETDCSFYSCQNLCTLVGKKLTDAVCPGTSDICPKQQTVSCSLACDPGTSCSAPNSISSLSCGLAFEFCDGLDNDCNGQIDDNIPPRTISCGIGNCTNTAQQTCVNGQWQGTCTPLPKPVQTEENYCIGGYDDDCDAKVDCADTDCLMDEFCGARCIDSDNDGYNGSSMPGTYCGNAIKETGELCDPPGSPCTLTSNPTSISGGPVCGNGNCDAGEDSNNCPNDCGVCDVDCLNCLNMNPNSIDIKATIVCGPVDCNDNNYKVNQGATELCNGIDDNCNGQIDETFPEYNQTCALPGKYGVCAEGRYLECGGGGGNGNTAISGTPIQPICVQVNFPTNETCNYKDDNCDNSVDTRTCYSGPDGTEGVGVCHAGMQSCVGDGTYDWGTCVGEVWPTAEVCDGLDNNCNGFTDDPPQGGWGTCNTGLPGACAIGQYICNMTGGGGNTALSSSGLVCQQTVFPAPESCNGIDDNCNGQVDEHDVWPPATTAGNVPADWVNHDVTVTFSAVDVGCGPVTATYCCVDQTDTCNPNPATSSGGPTSCTVTQEGINYVRFYSVDWRGNIEQTQSVTVLIDKTNPITTATVSCKFGQIDDFCKDRANAEMSATDELSGLSQTLYCMTDAATCVPSTPYAGEFIDELFGISSICYASTDNAGNAELAKCTKAYVDQDLDVDGFYDITRDKCDNLPGVFEGCPMGDLTKMELHIINQNKSGACPGGGGCCKHPRGNEHGWDWDTDSISSEILSSEAGMGVQCGGGCWGWPWHWQWSWSKEYPLENVEVKVFDRNDPAFKAAYTKNPRGSLYGTVFEANIGLISGCVTDQTGKCIAPETTTGDFLVIAKWIDGDNNNAIIYVGRPKSGSDFKSYKGTAAKLATKEMQIIKVIDRHGDITYRGGDKIVINGSMLEITYPDEVIWMEDKEVYPFVFTSDSDWTIDVCMQIPEGYQIEGILDEEGNLVATTDCTQTFVENESRAIVFSVARTGSPEPNFVATVKTTHEGITKETRLEIGGLKTETARAEKSGAESAAQSAAAKYPESVKDPETMTEAGPAGAAAMPLMPSLGVPAAAKGSIMPVLLIIVALIVIAFAVIRERAKIKRRR